MPKKSPPKIDAAQALLPVFRILRHATWLAIFSVMASEHHGQVRFGGLPVPGATVTAAQQDKNFSTITDQQGAYSFPGLPDGTWTLQVDMLCFSPMQKKVAIAPDTPPSEWDLQLLPLENIQALPTPGTHPAQSSKSVQTAFQRANLTASGDPAKPVEDAAIPPGDFGQSASDVFSINGSVNNGAASPFAQSQAFGNNRRAGRSLYNAGIGVFLDNSFLDARAFSLTGQDTPKPAYNHLQGVVSFGGPLRIPHLLRGNSVNFFAGYQWTRSRNASTQSALMPAAQQRNGDLSQALAIFDPANGSPFPGNAIPQSRISPQAKALLNFYPLPNFDPGARFNYQVPLTGSTDQDSVQSRLSKTVNRNHSVFGSFAYQRTATQTPNVFALHDGGNIAGIDTSINWFHRFHPRLFTTLKYEFSRLSTRVTPNFATRENVSAEAGISGNNQDPLNWGPPSLAFSSGIAGLSDAQQSFTRNQSSALSLDTYWNRGGHNLRFGGDFRRLQFNYLSQQDPRGAFTFTGAATQSGSRTGSDFADFLLGIPDTSSIAFGNADKYFRESSYDAYLADDWRISPAITLNAGLRWEYGSPVSELYGRLVNLNIAPAFTAETPVVGNSLVHPDKHGIEPRAGIAWRPLLASSMVIRAGYAVNYNTSVYQSIALQMAQQSPLSKSLSVQNSPADPLTLANGFNASSSITPNTFAVDPNFRVGYAQTWNASIQRDLPAALVLMAGYTGIKGARARQDFLPNTYPAGALNPCPACPTGYVYMASNGNSTRESGQLQLRRRLHNGFTTTLQYTFSKSIDDAALGGRGQGGAVIAQNWLDLSAERGLSTFDQRHLLSVQAQYSTGVGIGGGALLGAWRGALFKDWTFTTQITAGSGLPLTPIYVAAVRGTGVTGSIRPEYTGASVYAAPPGLFLNPSAYDAPLAGQWGNAGRDSVTGPSQFTLDASIGRAFPFRDHGNIDLRFDAVNALNHVTFPNWNATVTSAQFGLPNTANAMRALRATLRVRF